MIGVGHMLLEEVVHDAATGVQLTAGTWSVGTMHGEEEETRRPQ